MLLAVVYETVDEEGLKNYVAELRLIEEPKPISMMALGRRWTNQDIALLVQNHHNIKRVAMLLGRTEEACYKKLQRLGLSKTIQKENIIVMVFPEAQIGLRRAIVEQVMPRLKKLLDKIDKADDLVPKTIDELAKLVRATAALLNALEKWETGEEMLEIRRSEAEDADQRAAR